MIIVIHKNFGKKFKKLREGEKIRFKKRRNLFLVDPHDPLLQNHQLKGDQMGKWSINVGGDLRVIYKFEDSGTIIFLDIDTHSNLYN